MELTHLHLVFWSVLLALGGCSTTFAPEAFPYACKTDSDCVQGYVCFLASARADAQALCVESTQIVCDEGYADCNANMRCEVELLADPKHCGQCGVVCVSSERCEQGVCREPCAGNRCDDACVDVLSNPSHCGSCGVECGAGELCEAGACLCVGALCDGVCQEILVSSEHCGGCDRGCGAAEVCREGGCDCKSGYYDCDGVRGCESTLSEPETCGSCGVDCTQTQVLNASATCAEGECGQGCWPGFGDCDTGIEGCETWLDSSYAHCGQCGLQCDSGCVDGACGVATKVMRKMVGGANFTCGLKAHFPLSEPSDLTCVGSNSFGQLGIEIPSESASPNWMPTPIPELLANVTDVDAHGFHACALREDGTIWCWGGFLSPTFGENWVSLPTRVRCHPQGLECTTPVQIQDGLIEDAMRIAVGRDHICVIRQGGSVWCWGPDGKPGLGPNKPSAAGAPVEVPGVTQAVQITAGDEHTCARTARGEVWCWGSNDKGQLGTGSPEEVDSVPRVVAFPNPLLQHAMAIDTYAAHTCAVLSLGEKISIGALYCWGNNEHGQLGVDPGELTQSAVPVQISDWTDIVEVTTGRAHACLMDDANKIFCWGNDSKGQLGDRWPESSGAKLRPINFRDADRTPSHKGVGSGAEHTCARPLVGGKVVCWGNNDSGQVGQEPAVFGTTVWRAMVVGPREF